MQALQHIEKTLLPNDAVEVAHIGGAWGVRGGFRVNPYNQHSKSLLSCKIWYAQLSSKFTVNDGNKAIKHYNHKLIPPSPAVASPQNILRLHICEVKIHRAGMRAKADSIEDIDAASLLNLARIFLPRSAFPSIDNNEYYLIDLMGLSVFNRQNIFLGSVINIFHNNAQNILVINDSSASNSQNIMIPFVPIYIDSINLSHKRITVDWQTNW